MDKGSGLRSQQWGFESLWVYVLDPGEASPGRPSTIPDVKAGIASGYGVRVNMAGLEPAVSGPSPGIPTKGPEHALARALGVDSGRLGMGDLINYQGVGKRLICLVGNQENGGSNPPTLTVRKYLGVGKLGNLPRSDRGERWFESSHPDALVLEWQTCHA